MTARGMLLIAAVLLAGCPSYEPESAIYLQRITAVPVSLTAKVEHSFDDSRPSTLTLSEGAAMGLGCTEYCVEGLGPRAACERTETSLSPETAAEVRDAFMLDGREGTIVLIGKRAGTATLRITSPCVSAEYRVIIQ